MYTNQIRVLLKQANAYTTMAQSLRSCGISSWKHYRKQAQDCVNKAKLLNKADQTITLTMQLVS